jgi:hypothetical protein
VLGCFALPPVTRAVTPAPDGGYPDANTAEGTDALFTNTCFANTAIGFCCAVLQQRGRSLKNTPYKNVSKTRPIGSARKYIRPPALFATILVGMFAVVRAIDATPTPTPAPPVGIGCIYLANSYVSEPPIDPNTIPGITNPHMKGMLWRESWERLDRNGRGLHDWAFLDACMNASDSHAKDGAFQVLAGNFAPPWFFTLPGAKSTNAGSGLTTVPFDPVFQSVWQEVQTAMATVTVGDCACVT